MEQRYMEILFEEMRSRFDLVLEGHAALHAKIDDYRRESNERHELTGFLLKTLSGEVKQLRTDVNELRVDVNQLRTDVNAIRSDLTAHRADTERHSGYRVSE
jgi:uncharacterized coiled-coil DUF342 family protein